jgi:TPR repeat protein
MKQFALAPVALALVALGALALSACGGELGGASIQQATVPYVAHRAADPIEVAAKPCKFGDVTRCMDQCQDGTASACNALGVIYEYGSKTSSTDPTIASGFYARACDREYAPGCTNLAWLYSLGRGVPRDTQQAMLLFTRAFDQSKLACRRGDGHGCLMAGELLLQGQVTSSDENEEVALFQAACEQGERRGCDYVETLR